MSPARRELGPGPILAGALALAAAALGPAIGRAEQAGAPASHPSGAGTEAEPGAEPAPEQEVPAGAARRLPLAEPVGDLPGPWIALAAAIDGGAFLDGSGGWTALRVHVPVARRYGAVDVRMRIAFEPDGFERIDPELWLRAVPLRRLEGRGVLGLALGLAPAMSGPDPLLVLSGGLLGGYLGRLWFARGFVGLRGEVLERRAPPELLGQAAAGLRLAHGLRPQLELDVLGPAASGGSVSVTLRPALRYWPAAWIGIGVAGEALFPGAGPPAGALRLDVVVQALEWPGAASRPGPGPSTGRAAISEARTGR